MIAITLTDISGHILLRFVELISGWRVSWNNAYPTNRKAGESCKAMAQKEPNSEKLAAIIERMNRLLAAHEKRSSTKETS